MTGLREGVLVALAATISAIFVVCIVLTLVLPAGHARIIWEIGAPLGIAAGLVGGLWLWALPDNEFEEITSGEKAREALARLHDERWAAGPIRYDPEEDDA